MPDTEFPTSLITLTYWSGEDTEPIKWFLLQFKHSTPNMNKCWFQYLQFRNFFLSFAKVSPSSGGSGSTDPPTSTNSHCCSLLAFSLPRKRRQQKLVFCWYCFHEHHCKQSGTYQKKQVSFSVHQHKWWAIPLFSIDIIALEEYKVNFSFRVKRATDFSIAL